MIEAIASLLLVNLVLLTLAFLIWKRTWLERFGLEVPEEGDSSTFRHYSVSGVFSRLLGRLWDLKPEYWLQHCGTEAYLYLLYQRSMIRLLLIYSAVVVVATIPLNLATSQEEAFFTRTTIAGGLSSYASWFQVALVYFFSIGVFITTAGLRQQAGKVLLEHAQDSQRLYDHEWLLARTVHVRGLDKADRSGTALAAAIRKFLSDKSGDVVEVMLLPDYEKLLALEIQSEEARLMLRLMTDEPDRFHRLCFRGINMNPKTYSRKLEELEAEMQKATLAPFSNSGHAVVALDSLESVEKTLYNFRASLGKTLHLAYTHLKEKVFSLSRSRAFSTTFNRFEDDVEATHRDIIVTRAVEPSDLMWRNVGGTRGVYLFRRIGLLVLAFFVLLFMTTPAVIFSTLKSFKWFTFLNMDWAEELPGPLTNLVHAYFPSLMIIAFNQVLLLLIDLSSYLERHHAHSHVQLSIFLKCVPYLTLNMLVIPGVTLAAAESLVQILGASEFMLANVLAKLHLADSGALFVNLLLQKSCYSNMFYLLRGGEVGAAYGSSWLAYYIREDLNRHDKWRRVEFMVFQYGYFYAVMITGFAIVMTFCSTIPLVIPAGLFFFSIKHVVDGLNLLTVHKHEMDSRGNMLRYVCIYSLVCVLLYQTSMIGFFSSVGLSLQAFCVFVLMLPCAYLTFASSGPLYDLSTVETEFRASTLKGTCPFPITPDAIQRWRQLYWHPMYVPVQSHEKASFVEPSASE